MMPGTTALPEPGTTGPDGTTSTTGPGETDSLGQTTADVTSMTSGPVLDAGPPASECDLWTNDCPPGKKCASASSDGIWWDHSVCVDLVPMPDGVGDECMVFGAPMSGQDSCGPHEMCWFVDPVSLFGTCIAMCTGSVRDPICPPSSTCHLGGDHLITCLPDCDPLDPDSCPGDDLCVFLSPMPAQFVCAVDMSEESGFAFDPCEFANVCKPGLGCVESEMVPGCDLASTGCCVPFCDVNAPNTCPGQGFECVALFAPGEVPGKDHLGRCTAP
ncbi:hypothetical protein [Nannocystis bainbridge]|uniref:Uncharacterized protein n=1 Tax=Nannocystis bainbridge TaxID=2995303 RepID=A0ABT5ECN2_9BACT|nr:hypothetical protein [Nannocystis bainbridge]MDC0723612.1 hypothetical protein [Nannocystis bainbridge]